MQKPQQKVTNGELILDLVSKQATLRGSPLELTASEFRVLLLLASSPQHVYSRDEIADSLKGSEWEKLDRSLDMLISRLRTKLGDDPKHPTYIRTVRGGGYVFLG